MEVKFKMGGLVEDITRFYDPLNEIGGADWYRQVAEHWLDASRRHGMPVDERVFFDVKDEFHSTYPANIAFKAAEFQSSELANRFLRRVREAAAVERKAVHRLDVQAELAQEVGLERGRFVDDIKSGKAEKAFLDDVRECRRRGISGFPTFLVRYKGREVLLHGYQTFHAFEFVFRELAGGALKPSEISSNQQGILAFVRKYGKVAAKEIAEVFGMTMESASEQLARLEEKGLLKRQKAGNGFFYLAQKNPHGQAKISTFPTRTKSFEPCVGSQHLSPFYKLL